MTEMRSVKILSFYFIIIFEINRINLQLSKLDVIKCLHELLMDKPEKNEPQNKITTIEHLPNEILQIIFGKLDDENMVRASMVCRRWLGVAQQKKKCAICELLPPNCKAIMLFTRNISLNENLYKFSFDFSSMVYALLPEHRNVQLSTVIVHSSIQDSIPEETYTEYTQMIETASIRNHEFMCLMIFCDNKSSKLALRMVQIAESTFNHNKRVSLCGGMVEQVRTNNETNSPDCVALLITGSIRTWSIVLDSETMRLNLGREKLQKFKEEVKLQRCAVGFVFISIRKIPAMEDMLQNSTFQTYRQLFPNVPIIGCSSLHEFGRDTPTYEDKFLIPHIQQWYEKIYGTDWAKDESITIMILTYG